MYGIGPLELFWVAAMVVFYFVPIATLVFVILIYKNTKK
jgi:hypothetical protein